MNRPSLPLRRSQLLPIGLVALILLACIGVIAWLASRPDTPSQKAVKQCLSVYKDRELCNFTGNYNLDKLSYKMVMKTVGAVGTEQTMTYVSDGLGHSQQTTVSKDSSVSTVTLSDATYLKDNSDGKWIKFPSQTKKDTNSPGPADTLSFNTAVSKGTASMITYKKLGEDKCGKLTCLKYESHNKGFSTENDSKIFWFDTQDYRLQGYLAKDANGTTTANFTYQAVTIQAPTPVKKFDSKAKLNDETTKI